MCRKLIYPICFVFVLSLALTGLARGEVPTPDILWWKFDEGSGDTAFDSSGNGRDGTLEGATWIGGGLDPSGACLSFGGDGDRVIDDDAEDYLNGLDAVTVAMWIKSNLTGTDKGFIIGEPPDGGDNIFTMRYDAAGATGGGSNLLKMAVRAPSDEQQLESSSNMQTTEWQHVTMVWSVGEQLQFYADGVLDTPQANSAATNETTTGVSILIIGQGGKDAGGGWDGLVDDVRIYNSVLTAEQIEELVESAVPKLVKARLPDPPDGAVGVDAPLLQWTPGDTAISHLLYFGTDPDNLTFMGEMGWTVYWHGAGIDPGVTYFWRVDEMEPDGTIHTGDLWSFTATPLIAWGPSPADGATDVMITAQLSWSPGKTITLPVKHHLFFGTDEAAVADGTGDTDKGILDDPTYDPGLLKAETIYYVKVNEVESDGSEREGDIWSFETVPAGPGRIMRQWWLGIDGTALTGMTGNPRYPDDPDGWEWVDLFEGPVDWADDYGTRISGWLFPPATGEYTFWIATDDPGQCRLSTDEDPANAALICEVTGWVPSRDFDNTGGGSGGPEQKSAPITLEAGKRYFIEAIQKEDGGGDNIAVAWQGPGIPVREVISAEYVGATPDLPERAYAPSPGDGASDVPDTATLSWMAGVKAIQHEVYLGTDQAAVAAADATTPGIYRGLLSSTGYVPTESPLEWGQTFYWKVNEKNNDGTTSVGRVWSFTVADYIVVDDFEDYNDYSPDRIFQTWLDGYGYTDPPPGRTGNGTGSTVGHLTYPYAEQTTVHGGGQSMPFGYDNTGAGGKARYSEAEREYAFAQNFSRKGVKSMSLWVYGDPCNVPAPVYVGLQDSTGTRVDVPDTDTDIVMRGRWQEINIEFSKFSPVNLGSIRKIYLGVGNRLSPMPGPTGSLFIDDIRLYGPRCVASKLKPAASLNDDCIVDYLDVEMLSDNWLLSDVAESVWDASFTNGDIGVPLAGSYSFDGTTYTITGNGHDIWDEADDFHYAYHQMSGDVQMTVRVKSMTQVHSWAKAGIMIRDTLDAGSANAMVALTGGDGNGGTFQWRTDPDVASGSSRTLTGITVPTCVRLVREGDTFTGYIFLDGRWQQEGTSVDVVMTDPVYIGLAVTSHTDGVLETATFDRECTFSAAELHADGVIDFKDFAVMADAWLDELLWPAEP